MALTLEECRRLVELEETSGKTLTVGFNRRFAPYYVAQKERLRNRGGPAVVSCRINSPGISGTYWMADPEIGGAILGEACHFVDLMYWLLDSEPVEVSAYSFPADLREPIGENNMVASFRFADGSIGNLTYCTVGSKTSGGERVEVFTPQIGVITEDCRRLSIRGTMQRNSSRFFAAKGYDLKMKTFIESLTSGNPWPVTARDGARSTIGCLKMLESARSGRPCAIDLDALLAGTGVED